MGGWITAFKSKLGPSFFPLSFQQGCRLLLAVIGFGSSGSTCPGFCHDGILGVMCGEPRQGLTG